MAHGTERRVRVGHLDVHAIDRGSGPAVLLLHGNPDSSRLWLPLIERLAPNHRCIAPDLPGFGRTAAPREFDYSLESLARFVEELVIACGLPGRVSLVVHDIGGPFGLAWATRHPERVGHLGISNTLFHSDYRWHPWGRVWRTPVLGELSMRVMTRRLFSRELRRGSRRLPPGHAEATYQSFTPEVRRAVLRLYRALDPERFHGWEEALLDVVRTVPTRVIWGAHDPYIPLAFAGRFGTDHVRILAGCGHWVPVEEPGILAAELRELFQQNQA